MIIHQPCSKTDQLRKGDELLIARTRNATCPVAMLEWYMRQMRTSWEDQCFFFRPICKSKGGERLKASGSISYSYMRGPLQEVESLRCGSWGLWAAQPAGRWGNHSSQPGCGRPSFQVSWLMAV